MLPGIVVAIVLSLANFVRRAWRPYDAVLGRVPGRKGYHDIERHPDAAQIPGLVLYRFDAPLFFANAEVFADRVMDAVQARDDAVRWVIVAAEPMTDVDTTAADVLGELLDDLQAHGIALAFAELKGPVKDRLRDYGLADRVGDDRFFPTLGTAIDGYLDGTGIDWVDWSDESPTTTPASTEPRIDLTARCRDRSRPRYLPSVAILPTPDAGTEVTPMAKKKKGKKKGKKGKKK